MWSACLLCASFYFITCGNNSNKGKEDKSKSEDTTQNHTSSETQKQNTKKNDPPTTPSPTSPTTTPPVSTKTPPSTNTQNNGEQDPPTNNSSCLVINGMHHPGLQNKGNSCYLNSIMQQLYHLEPFRTAVLKSNPNSDPTLATVQKFFEGMEGVTNSYFDPGEFVVLLGYEGDQEDANDFFLSLTDKISTELGMNTNNFVSNLFEKKIINTTVCQDCKHNSTKSEILRCIPCDVGDYQKLEDSLEYFLGTEEVISGYKCGNCCYVEVEGKKVATKEVEVKKSVKFESLPEILVCQLKRFKFDKNTAFKVNNKFEFPQTITFKQEWGTDVKSTEIQRTYELSGVVIHSGDVGGGHYYSYVKLDNGDWYEFNDSTVSQIDIDNDSVKNILYGDGKSNTSGYILFYSKKS